MPPVFRRKTLVKVFGRGFTNDFTGADLASKEENSHGKGEYVSPTEMNYYFNKLPLIFTPYGMIHKEPSSEPI